MAYYIKVPPSVAVEKGLDALRNRTSDGNYLLWQEDFRSACPSMELSALRRAVTAAGGLLLSPSEAREECDGTTIRPLPEVSDSTANSESSD